MAVNYRIICFIILAQGVVEIFIVLKIILWACRWLNDKMTISKCHLNKMPGVMTGMLNDQLTKSMVGKMSDC
jgi:hypothetical protein